MDDMDVKQGARPIGAIERLTNSRLTDYRRCPRLDYYRNEMLVRPIDSARPLRFGSAWHAGLEAIHGGKGLTVACAGAAWYYETDPARFESVEQVFDLPLVNPDTGRPSRTFSLAGKIDVMRDARRATDDR